MTGFLSPVIGNIHCPLAVGTHCQGCIDSFSDNGRSSIEESLCHTQFVLQRMVGAGRRNSGIGWFELACDIPENLCTICLMNNPNIKHGGLAIYFLLYGELNSVGES